MNKKVGVIGGMGPMATAKFMELVINNTKALRDQDNVNMLVAQYPVIPDRTEFILGKSTNDPASLMIKTAKELESAGCDFLVMPCNTATYFYDCIAKEINIPLVNIVKETVDDCMGCNCHKIGLMATSGTIESRVYNQYISDNVELFIPDQNIQDKVMNIIYNDIKQNKMTDKNEFLEIINYFKNNNCDKVVIGCTELSVACNQLNIQDDILVDSLLVLARTTILRAGHELK